MSGRKGDKDRNKYSRGDSSDSENEAIDGIRTAAEQLTLSASFLASAPKSVRDWTTKDTQAWLRDIFDGSTDLESYIAQFGKFGIRGIDLLSSTEKQLAEFGIVHSVHINRAKISISQLIVYQQAYDKKLKKEQKLREKERPYYDILDEAAALKAKNPPYQSPSNIKYWKAVDVFMWLEAKENVSQLGLYVKPFALERISGKELLEMVTKPDDHFHEICRTLKQGLTPVDIQRLKDAITNKKKYYEELNKKIKETKLKEMDKAVVKIEKMKVLIKNISVLGAGNFGIVYSAILKNQRVVLKRVKMKAPANSNEERTDPSKKPKDAAEQKKQKPEEIEKKKQKEEQHQKLLKFKEESLLREAYMMAKCSGKGVVRLIGQGEVKGTRLIAMEFMSGQSVEQEITRASKDDGTDSIFHPQHKDNVDLVNRLGVNDPVLYQILRIGRDVASALARIHSLGVIHLDIAARNILLDRDKRPKITDFGMARLENDMIEQSSYRAALIDEATSKNMGEVERDVYLKWDHKDRRRGDVDETEQDLILEIFEGEVPIPWMPIWTLIDKKVVDRHWDVYSFGCLLYEMALRQPPFQGTSHKDMYELKQSLDTHPKLSTVDFPRDFIDIVNLAWSPYEQQPLMPVLCDKLTALHKSVVSGTNSVSAIDQYLSMKENLGIPNQLPSGANYSTAPAVAPTSSYSKPPATSYSTASAYSSSPSRSTGGGGGYGVTATFPAPNPAQATLYSYSQAKSANLGPQAEAAAVPPLLKKFIVPKRVRLTIDPNDLEGPKDLDKIQLEQMLDCALSSQDYIFILEILSKIPPNNDELQIEIISKCFTLLKSFAENSHMSSDDDDVWKHIIERIGLKLSEANAETSGLARNHLLRLTNEGMAAIASLLKGKYWEEDEQKDAIQSGQLSSALKYLCTMLCYNLKTFTQESPEIARQTSAAISVLAMGSDTVREQLHKDGVVKQLIEALDVHPKNGDMVKDCFSAIGAFYLNQILQAVPLPPPARNQAPPDPKVLIDSWKLYPAAFFDSLRNFLPATAPTAGDTAGAEVEGVIQVILSAMLDICNNGVEEYDELEKLFVNTTAEDLQAVLQAIQFYPKNFRIQEGGIGVLSSILQTGQERPELRVSPNTDPTILTFVLPHEERVKIFIQKPEHLDQVLAAMETFSVDDKIAIGIRKDAEATKQQQEYYSKGLYFSGTAGQSKKKALNANAGYGGGYAAYGGNKYGYSPVNDKGNKSQQNNQVGRDHLLEEFEKAELYFDEEGKHISAAILQKSAAVIIGLASMANPSEIQTRLYRTRYNELILQALKNFKNDVNLTHFAFIALYYTSRKNTMHQVFLHELSITKHLYAALVRFQSVCDEMPDSLVLVLEGVTGGLVGLLEPQDDQTGTANPINFNILTKTAALALEKEMGNITINKESPSYKYCRELADYLTRADPEKYTEVEEIAYTLLTLRNPLVVNLLFGDEQDWHSVYVMFFKLLGTILFWSPYVLDRWTESFIIYFHRDDDGDILIGEDRYFLLNLGFIPFVLSTLRGYQLLDSLHPNVLAAGLSLLTSICRLRLGDAVLFGEEIPSIHIRGNAQGRDELLSFCLLASKEQHHHPILIRYSLWLMIYLIAGRSIEPSSVKANDELKVALENNRDMAAEIALSNGIEWAIEAMKAFPDYYTIQCLAVLFLIWMERRGHFAKRKSALEMLKEILNKILENTTQYKTLEEEGHDTSLIGRSIYMFGDLQAHADRLLRLIDSHLVEKQEIVHNSWDGLTRPLRIEAIRFEKEEDETGRNVNVFTIEVTWENRFDPKTHSYQPFTWKLKKRHAAFAKFQQEMLKQFPSLPPLFSEVAAVPTFGRLVKLVMDRSPEFLDGRRAVMNQSFDELYDVRATLANPVLLSFIEADKHVTEMRSARALPSIAVKGGEFPINDMKIDEEEGLVFIGTGVPYSIFQNTSIGLRGHLMVYRIVKEDLKGDGKPGALPPYRLEEVTRVGFSFGVQCVAWDRSRRCVAVGFSMGLISYYSFKSGNSLVYAGEQDYHTDVIVDMKFVHRERKLFLEYEMETLLVAISQGSRCTIVDMKDGGVISQVAKAANGARLVSSVVDVMDSILVLGTDQGSILTYDITSTTPEHIATLTFNHANSYDPKDPGTSLNNKGGVLLALANAQRIVYCAHHNKIFACQLGEREDYQNPVYVRGTLTLAIGIQITAMELIHYDRLLVVTCSNGSVLIYDMSEADTGEGARESTFIAETTSPVAGKILAVTAMVQQAQQRYVPQQQAPPPAPAPTPQVQQNPNDPSALIALMQQAQQNRRDPAAIAALVQQAQMQAQLVRQAQMQAQGDPAALIALMQQMQQNHNNSAPISVQVQYNNSAPIPVQAQAPIPVQAQQTYKDPATVGVSMQQPQQNYKDPNKGVVLASGHDASAKLHNEYATTASHLLPWHEVVKLKESALRDWLRGKGEGATKISSRSGLLLAVLEKAGEPLRALTEAVSLKNPHADVLFAHRFGSNKEKTPFPIFKSIVMLEGYQTLLLGGQDGYISRYSLLDFYPAYHGSDAPNMKSSSAAKPEVLEIFTTTKTSKTQKYIFTG